MLQMLILLKMQCHQDVLFLGIHHQFGHRYLDSL